MTTPNATTSIFLATPCYGGLTTIAYMSSVLALQRACIERRTGLQVELGGGDALISRARGVMAGKFLEHTTHSHLLFIDADRDVVGGVYPAKHAHWDKAKRAFEAGAPEVPAASYNYVVRYILHPENRVEVDEQGFGPVAHIGTDFMLIRRQALQRVADAHPELRAEHGNMNGPAVPEAPMVFETMIEAETGEHLSEDYAFFRRWRDMGGEIFADFETRLMHVGHAAYEGSLKDSFAR